MTSKPVGWKNQRTRHRDAYLKGRFGKLTNRQLLYRDFDGDGVRNIDDSHPFNPRIKDSPEIYLSDEFRHIQKHRTQYEEPLNKLIEHLEKQGYKTKHRVKSRNSLINKFRRRLEEDMWDVGGAMVLTQSDEESRAVGKYIRKHFKVIHVNDYISNPKDLFYRALHYYVKIDGKILEIQIKTEFESKVHLQSHTMYKKGQLTQHHKKHYHTIIQEHLKQQRRTRR